MNYDNKLKRLFVISAILVLSGVFLISINKNWDLIFQKELHGYDQNLNFTVSANISRQFFPPMVRVNPLIEKVDNWTEGPYWQHIPPLFTYIPLPLFILDGQITVETVRFSYLLLILFGAYLLIVGMYYLRLPYRIIVASTIASVLLITNKFSWEIISGWSFGVSDILLEFSIIASFIAIGSYIIRPKYERKNFSIGSIMLIAVISTLPLLIKNVLGAIPLATFLIVLFYDERFNLKVRLASLSSILLVLIHYGILFLSSQQTFLQEIVVPFKHFNDYENWARPWHAFFSDYLPNRYLYDLYPYYCIAIVIGIIFLIWRRDRIESKSLKIISLSIIWFFANLIAISLVTSKVPGSIYQTFILSLFFIFSIAFEMLIQIPGWQRLSKSISDFHSKHIIPTYNFWGSVVIIIMVVVGIFAIKTFVRAQTTRHTPYNYVSQDEKFYQFAEIARNRGIDERDLFIINAVPDRDYWFRYYTIFLTGAESRRLSEVVSMYSESRFEKYRNVYFVTSKTYTNLLSTISNLDQIEEFGDFIVLKISPDIITQQYIENIYNLLQTKP